jgi:hypothetical protein
MYQGYLEAISNREDWIFQTSLTDDDGTDIDLQNATIGVWITTKENTSTALLSAETTFAAGVASGDSEITLLDDEFTSFQFWFTKTDVSVLCPDTTYRVFCRVVIDGMTTQLLSCFVQVADGGPA